MAAQLATTSAARVTSGYWRESLRPLVVLAFVAPLLIGYEAGILWLGPQAIRNAADVWLRGWLDLAGFGQYFLLPVLICTLLLAWQHASHQAWQVNWRVVRNMWLEAGVLAIGLLLAAHLMARLCGDGLAGTGTTNVFSNAISGEQWQRTAARVVGYLGAGIYEEFFFRFLLLAGVALALQRTGLNRRGSLLAAIAATSVLFALAHYRCDVFLFGRHWGMMHGDAFTWYSFLFRCSAGAVFGALFAYRGFGIAAGTHALYDLLIVLL